MTAIIGAQISATGANRRQSMVSCNGQCTQTAELDCLRPPSQIAANSASAARTSRPPQNRYLNGRMIYRRNACPRSNHPTRGEFGASASKPCAEFGSDYCLNRISAMSRKHRKSGRSLALAWTLFRRPNFGDCVEWMERGTGIRRLIVVTAPLFPSPVTTMPIHCPAFLGGASLTGVGVSCTSLS